MRYNFRVGLIKWARHRDRLVSISGDNAEFSEQDMQRAKQVGTPRHFSQETNPSNYLIHLHEQILVHDKLIGDSYKRFSIICRT